MNTNPTVQGGDLVQWIAPHPHFSNVAGQVATGVVVHVDADGMNAFIRPTKAFDANSRVLLPVARLAPATVAVGWPERSLADLRLASMVAAGRGI